MDTVYEYFKSHPNVAYSVTTVAKRLNMKRGNINRFLASEENTHIKRVEPVYVGSGKKSVNVFKYYES